MLCITSVLHHRVIHISVLVIKQPPGSTAGAPKTNLAKGIIVVPEGKKGKTKAVYKFDPSTALAFIKVMRESGCS